MDKYYNKYFILIYKIYNLFMDKHIESVKIKRY